jgi:glutamyl-tRNA synthetase
MVQERINLLTEAGAALHFFLADKIDPPTADVLVAKKSTPETTVAALKGALAALKGVEDFSESVLEETLRALADSLGIKAGQVFMPIRVAVSGSTATPGLFEVLTALGKARVLERIEQAIEVLE